MLSRATLKGLLSGILAPVSQPQVALVVCDAMDPGLRIISVSEAFTELTGYTANEAVGRGANFLQGPGTDKIAAERLLRDARAGLNASGSLLLYRRDGSDFIDHVEVSPTHNHSGELRLLTVIHREMKAGIGATPRQRIQFTLSPEQYLVSIAVPGGVEPDWLDRISVGDRARLAHATRSCAQRGTDLLLTLRISNPVGVETETMLRARRMEDTASPGEITYQGDLSEPSGAVLLAARLRLLEDLMSQGNDGIIVTEAGNLNAPGPRILYVNETVVRHTGYRQDQLIGQSPRCLQGPLTDPAEKARFGAALRRWEHVTSTLLNYRSDGSTFWNEISCTPIADEHGWWTHYISIQRDVTERMEATQRAAFLADHDPLTGLANRRLAGDRLAQGLRLATEDHSSCGVVKLDLDRFKPVNDTYGHAAGDAVLTEVATRLRGAARIDDTVARIGGDEFVVVMPALGGLEDLQLAASRFQSRVSGPFQWNGRNLMIEASVGAAMYPEDADEQDGLLAAADTALHRAKARGRGRAHVFGDALRAEVSEKRRIGEDLHGAVDRDEFVVFYQPKVRLDNRRLVGFEALVRWRHPRTGLVRPIGFMEVAEANGLMRRIDERVIQQVAQVAARWTAAGFEFGRIAINISADSFAEPGFVATLAETLDRSGMDPRHIVIEIVESTFIGERAGNVLGKLNSLRRMGIRIELDDFGTGYAALAHLKFFKVDGIKLDRSFVMGIGSDREGEIITNAIVGLARNLGIGCVAEGVETQQQLDYLRLMGCEFGQGYLFGMPADEAAATSWIRGLAATDLVVEPGRPLQESFPP